MEKRREQTTDGRIQFLAGFIEKVVEDHIGGGAEIVQAPVKGDDQQRRNGIGNKGRLRQSFPGRIGQSRIGSENPDGHPAGPINGRCDIFIGGEGQLVQDETDDPDADNPEADVKQDRHPQNQEGWQPGKKIMIESHGKTPFFSYLPHCTIRPYFGARRRENPGCMYGHRYL